FDQIVYQFQDKFIDLKKVIAAIEATGKKVADTMNTYARETLMHGRISLAVQDFKQNEIKPILEALEKNKVDIKTFEQYLHARHAHERNAAMAKLHPTQAEINARITQLDAAIQAGKRANTNTAKLESERDALQNTAPWSGTLDDRNKLSGMSDQDAANILRTTPKAPLMRHLADRVDDMTRKTRHEMLAYGLETAETVDALDRAYQHYVPLFRDMEESDLLGSGNGSGQGLNVRGSSIRRATGSLREVEHIFAHLAQQREAVIARGEKNLVQQSLWNLVTDNPNAAFWAAISPKMSADQMRQALLQTGSDPSDVNDIVRSLTEPVIDRVTGVVRTRVKSTIARMPNVVSLRINGEDRLIVLSRKNDTAVRLAQALRNEDQAWFPSGAALSEVGRVTRWLASVNTQYNPVFGMTNFTRDIQESLINLSSTELAGKQGDVLKGIWSAGTAIWATVRGKNPSGPWAKYYREFLESGAATGYRDSYANIEDRAKAIEAEMYGKGIRNATGRRLSRCTLISAQSAPGAV
ncbi:MAG: hypothetical protein LBB76_07815, partial [Azoarcus sp.]|nr:hypothetical protein [Azoarcus sp.]